MSWDTVSPGYRPLSWGYPGILRVPPVSHDANLRFQTVYMHMWATGDRDILLVFFERKHFFFLFFQMSEL